MISDFNVDWPGRPDGLASSDAIGAGGCASWEEA